jgi:tetratricopeptide (TPR) repeat protein
MQHRYFFIAIFLFCFGTSFAASNSLIELQTTIMQEDFKKGEELAKGLLSQNLSRPEKAQVEYYLGLSQLRQGDYAPAYDTFKKLIAERPATDIYDKAYVGLVDSLYMQGSYEQALKEATGLMARRADSELMPLITLKVARANLKLARWKKARELLQKVIADYPESFESNVARQLLDEKQYFAVQVGAFGDKPRAETTVQELLAKNEYAYIVETHSNDGKTLYRVRVGQLTTLKDARLLETKLSGQGYPTLIYP